MSLRVGLTAPWDLDALAPDERRLRLAAYADAGIDHLFTADHVSFVGGSGLDGVVKLATWSGIEPRLDLHLGVFLLALRHPMVAARQIATLADAAPGRVVIGVGVGGEDRHEFEVCGIDPSTRGRRTDAALGTKEKGEKLIEPAVSGVADILRRMIAGEEIDCPPVTFRPEGRLHMVNGKDV